MSKLVSIKEASKATGLSYRFLRDKIVKGEYPALIVGSERKIHKVNVQILTDFINDEQLKNVRKKTRELTRETAVESWLFFIYAFRLARQLTFPRCS